MDTALPQKFPFILDRNLAKANCAGNRFCTSCDIVVLGKILIHSVQINELSSGAISPLIVATSRVRFRSPIVFQAYLIHYF